MNSKLSLRNKGMKILINNLGYAEAERFISLIAREPFDCREYQRDLFNNLSEKKLNKLTKKYKTDQ